MGTHLRYTRYDVECIYIYNKKRLGNGRKNRWKKGQFQVLTAALDEITGMHKLVKKQAKKISLLQSQLEETKSKEEKEVQDDENGDVKADLEVALLEIRSLSDFIKK